MTFKELKAISYDDLNKKLWVEGKIITVKQTGGPTLMIVTDGTANFTLKAFKAPGERAYPQIDMGDYVKAFVQVNERNSTLEGEVSQMEKLSLSEQESFEKRIDRLQNENASPKIKDFSIQSKVLEALKPRFIDVATRIRRAIYEGRPILLRHDADCDGYSSAICMERAILGLMDEVTGGDVMARYQNYRRAPSKAPFYDYEDSVKDLATWLRDKVKNGAMAPLIIITDNGSTEEDILSYKQMKVYDCQIVVLDHHYPGEKDKEGKVAVDHIIDGHINPYLEGFDMNVCSGMLGYEMARFIYEKNSNAEFIPAMAALLDHTEGHEKDTYVKKAIDAGYTQEYMEKLGEIVYLQSHYLRFMEGREFVDDLFGRNMDLQKKLVEMLSPELEKRYERIRTIAKHYSDVEDYGPFYVVHFNGEKGTGRGQYPAVGRSTNKVHDMFEKKLDKPVITMTSGPTFLTIRVGDAITGFSVPDFCSIAEKNIPHTAAEGGGHEHAGSVKFVEYGYEEVIGEFKKYLKDIANKQN